MLLCLDRRCVGKHVLCDLKRAPFLREHAHLLLQTLEKSEESRFFTLSRFLVQLSRRRIKSYFCCVFD